MREAKEKTILLVEDEAVIAISEKKELEKYGYAVIAVVSGETAIETCRRDPSIDLILMDIDLGKGMDGAETATRILQMKVIPIVFLSSHSEPEIVAKSESITSYGYVVKTSNITVLDASIKMAFKLFDANKKTQATMVKLEATLEALPDLLLEVGLDGFCYDFHSHPQNPLHQPQAERIGKNISDSLPSQAASTMMSAVHEAHERGSSGGKQYELASPVGTRWFEISAAQMAHSFDDPRFILLCRDITERKRSEEQYITANKIFQAVLDSMPQYICWKDRNSVFLGCNKNHSALFDLPDTESIIGKTDWDLHRGKAEIEKFIKDDRDVMESDTPKYHIIEKAFYPNGRQRWLDTNKVPIHDARGEVYGIMIAYSDITEKMKTEDALAQEQFLLDTLLNNSTDYIYFKDIDSRFIRNSKSHAVHLGLQDPRQMIGKTDFDFFTAEHAQRAFEDEQAIIRTGRAISKEERNIMLTGDPTWVLTVKMPLRNNDGAIIGTFGISRDITERKHAEVELAQEHYLLQTLMETTPDYIFFKDRLSRFIKISASQLRKFGLKDETEIIGKTDFDFFADDHARQAYDDEQTIIGTGRILKKEEKETWSDRPDSWVYSIKLPLRDIDGNIIGTFGISRDITELKQTEEALAREKHLMDALMDTSADYIYFKDKDSRFIKASKAHARYFGLDNPSQMVGKTDFDFFTIEHAQQAYDDEQEIIRTGKPFRKEEKETVSDRPAAWVLSEKMPLRDTKGNIVGTFGISRDITERKGDEDRIKDLLKEKETILKEVHHRIKNNMTIIKSLLSLQASTVTEPNAVKALKDAEGRIESMLVLYEKLYQSSDFTTVSVREYLSSLVDRIVENFPNRETVIVEKHIDEFDLDIKQLQTLGIIVNELITNVLKYAFDALHEGKITLSGNRRDSRVVVCVQDDGIGIPQTVDFDNSTGFGLMLVKALTEQLRGNIRIDRGKGTKVVLDFEG
jgi:PAS domain S-box-containing protein